MQRYSNLKPLKPGTTPTAFKKKHKYNACPVEVDGIRFASAGEAARYKILKVAEKAKVIKNLRLQPRYLLIPKPNKIELVADFEYMEKGKLVIEDYKGMETDVFKLKLKLFKHFHPDKDFRIVKGMSRANLTLAKKSA